MALTQEVRALYLQAIAGTGLRNTQYPVDAQGATLKALASAWKFNTNATVVVAKATILVPWRAVGGSVNTISADAVINYKVGAGAGAAPFTVEAWTVSVERDSGVGYVPSFFVPFAPTIQPNGTTDAVVCDIASGSGNADTGYGYVIVQTGFGS